MFCFYLLRKREAIAGFVDILSNSNASLDPRFCRLNMASAPSLRARESVVVPATTRPSTPIKGGGGGNVKVVVRVRGFLNRGLCADYFAVYS